MTRRLLMLTLLLTMETGCPHAFEKGGTLDMALAKDLEEEQRSRRLEFPCQMSKKDWLELCDDREGRTISPRCPKECRPR